MTFIIRLKILPQVNKLEFSEIEDLISKEGFQIIKTEILREGVSTYFVIAKKL